MRASRENAKPTLLRRVLACLVSAAMVVAFTPVVAWGEGDVSYRYCDENGANWQTGTKSTSEYTEITDSITNWSDGWYVANGDVTIGTAEAPQRVTVSGAVHLILADNCSLTVNGGIQVQDNDNDPSTASTNSLTIYGQTLGTGKLVADAGTTSDNAGIGGGYNGAGGSIEINGGRVEAIGELGAGIGGGYGADQGGSVRITGGTVEAKGATGIGGGYSGGDGGGVTISGGTVTATSIGNGAGIGGGYGGSGNTNGGNGGTVTITGGTVTAIGVSGSAGIGGGKGSYTGNGGNGGAVTITGGTVIATAHSASTACGAGIGGGNGGGNGGSNGAGGTFKTNDGTNNGNAVIFASSISDTSNQDSWSGVIFKDIGTTYSSGTYTFSGGDGTIYGSSATPSESFTMPSGSKLTINDDQTLTIAENTTLTNNGSITNNGTIINMGTITGSGTISGKQPVVPTYYVDANGTSQKQVNAIEVTANDTEWTGGATADNPVWYVVKDTVTIGDGNNPTRVKVNGHVNLILADGKTLNATYGIEVSDPNSLTVYAQSTGDSMGTLVANPQRQGENAGIGGNGVGSGDGGSCGTVTINGGTINAKSSHGAGIGGGSGGSSSGGSGGTITINGGTVTAMSTYGAGIGRGNSGGVERGSSGTITITGGVVYADSDQYAGIGGSSNGDSGSVSISGGTVRGKSGEPVAGIGGDGTTVAISGGAVEGIGERGAGIGGSSITISGGVVTAWSSAGHTGISGTFNTGENGKAVIFAEEITDQSGKADGSWSGVIFECDTISLPSSGITVSGGKGKVYGSSVTPTESFTVPDGATLVIPTGSKLDLSGITVVNEGTVYVDGTLRGTFNENSSGAVCYLLTLEYASVDSSTPTGNTSEYNSKLYGKADGTIMLTRNSDPSVGYSATWSATPPVDFNGDSFTMPSNALTITATQKARLC